METPVDIQQNEGQYGVIRQGTRYLKCPDWADYPEAQAIPAGPSLNLNWADINTRNTANWYDLRV